MLSATREQVQGTINWYLRRKKPFTYEVQNDSMMVISKWGSLTTVNREYKITDLHFIRKVRQYILKNELYLPFKDFKEGETVYFDYGKKVKPGNHFPSVVNIDLTAAYWETANQLGLLSPETYEEGMSWDTAIRSGKDPEKLKRDIKSGKSKVITKKVRLAAIGSLAKKRRFYEFDGKKEVLKDIKRQEHTQILWDVITTHVGKVLQEAAKACGNDFIFFWVDGIFIKNGAESKVKAVFKKHGYKFKTNAIKSIDIGERTLYVNLKEQQLKRIIKGVEVWSDQKPFPFRQK